MKALNAFQFLQEVKTEASKVSWPSRQQTIRDTIIVIAFSAVVALLLSFFDIIFSEVINFIA
ncbi:MAG: preprotein translocase subunit SecE [Candidatus Wildermuthbacteria bacterium RIFCSPHIGHO2_12_FULL_45_9]|uniref:Protein translocase subunit SecE n=1 Tax=Candidatus Wildermuthbacteria bacterium RIFCSPHIGHO2_02_FULL_45_25 TaxID=1802450 RepID=A0A1G2QYQ0_9BACT|nr:MAG: preprotein translocase subunit SecE [Candidatus Wildermuthbacteria bacterium RIFCSPHIGHO2_01_FULL_45_20]OHA65259.1 MAG: preprotein translocase subunit SecE [Candidatus Wildermuthbacteria bacterium RIFCSPHIGHO2_02_FULL_45_25]OHA71448.1 MAG: preprotein translocase subunit SecE [Candidatus Wildermuthbacteria bacterium RIFCSPHIGHO2_12_FULL_45_9]